MAKDNGHGASEYYTANGNGHRKRI